jgi:predicted DCC family thiol-disulfide oxidoreductase YuxK
MKQLKVFYDGACVLCHNEIMHYKQKDDWDLLDLIDISVEDFKAEEFGLEDSKVNLHMHTIDSNGTVFTGVDSFIEIWRRVPPYNLLIPVFRNRLLRPGIDVGYEVFAKFIRPRLPKRDCQNGACAA